MEPGITCAHWIRRDESGQDVIAVRKDQVLFGVSDGHLRLILWGEKVWYAG